MIIQFIFSLVFVSVTKEEGFLDEYGNLIQPNISQDKISLMETEKKTKEKQNNILFYFLCKRKRFKKGVKYLPAISYGIQVIIITITIYTPQNEWWPPLLCDIILLTMAAYYIKKLPYADARYNHWSIALLFNNFFAFFRSFLINTAPENDVMVKIATFGIFFTPVILLLGYIVSVLRSIQLKYDESDDYDEIETKSDAKNKLNLKYANIIIDKIIELKLK